MPFPAFLSDVSTDLDNPPDVRAAPKPLGPLPDGTKRKIAATYKDVRTLRVRGLTLEEVFEAGVQVARVTPTWTLGLVEAETGHIEGVAESRLWKFKDDFVVRILCPAESPVLVDMRSKSRVGQFDWGVNAARIKDYLDRLTDQLRRAGGDIVHAVQVT